VDVVLGAAGEDQFDRAAVGDFGRGRHPFGGVVDARSRSARRGRSR
jgi:hypothetical protein